MSKTWQPVYVQDPTLEVDGFKILDMGHLTTLEDPEVRKIAAKYGDPDAWLSQEPASLLGWRE